MSWRKPWRGFARRGEQDLRQSQMQYMSTIPGPDLGTKTRRFKLPEHNCDAHCHVFGTAAVLPRTIVQAGA
jgi:hypothetical protein